MKLKCSLLLLFSFLVLQAQDDPKMYDIINAVSADRLEADITALANFGTRHTLSDTVSTTRGIGAARRWIKSEYEKISADCGNCLEVFFQKDLVEQGANNRIVKDVWVVNVVAIQRGTKFPNRFIIMSGDIDSRASVSTDGETDAPGANDNASGTSTVIELTQAFSAAKPKGHGPKRSILALLVCGEEKGLLGSQYFIKQAPFKLENIIANVNVDMVGRTDELHDEDDQYIYVIGADKLSSEVFHKYQQHYFDAPKIIQYKGFIYIMAADLKKAKMIEDVFKNNLLIANTLESDLQFLEDSEISYLGNWEAEKYRQKL